MIICKFLRFFPPKNFPSALRFFSSSSAFSIIFHPKIVNFSKTLSLALPLALPLFRPENVRACYESEDEISLAPAAPFPPHSHEGVRRHTEQEQIKNSDADGSTNIENRAKKKHFLCVDFALMRNTFIDFCLDCGEGAARRRKGEKHPKRQSGGEEKKAFTRSDGGGSAFFSSHGSKKFSLPEPEFHLTKSLYK
jgi:hypothetical protein